ncbi:hypothetical protein [Burkholderia anthina]|uniref:hypothetical protein n=1 Tax=Burkholderia anthina TaxID=179879 RepID=UPI001AA0AA76|nr:hypothetical protein [Burkholderia anthina]QTD88874.1 hypothetical protein J4G50_13765 [Burkholderia anthina]
MPTWIDYAGALQQQALQRQYAQIQLADFQQKQQDRQRQQAALTAAGNALPMLLAGQQQQAPQLAPPPQPPNPGQSSVSMQQPSAAPGQMPPLPPGMPPGAAGTTGAPGKPPLPPFQPMPSAGAQPSQMPQISAPPTAPAAPQQSGGPLTLDSAIKVLKDQGLSGADLMAGLQQLTPILDSQAKMQAAQIQQQFQHELQIANLQERYDALRQRAQDNALNRQDREQAHDDSMAIRREMIGLSRQRLNISINGGAGGGAPAPNLVPDAQGNLPTPKAIAGYSSEAIKALAEDYAVRGPTALAGFGKSNLPPAARAEVINYAAALNNQRGQNFATNKAQYAADTAGARANATQAAKVDAAANALVQTGGIGDQFQESIDALNRTGVPFANEAQMEVLRRTNDPRVAAFDAAQNGVVSEAAQILGRGTLTVNSMEEARRVVSGWKTSAAAKAGLAQLKREAATTVKASSEEVAKSARTPKGQPGLNAIPAGWSVQEH